MGGIMGMAMEVGPGAQAQGRSSGPETRPEQATDHTTDPLPPPGRGCRYASAEGRWSPTGEGNTWGSNKREILAGFDNV